MYYFKNGLGYFNEDLPTKKWNETICIDRKCMVGMILSGVYCNRTFSGLEVVEYIQRESSKFIILYNNKQKHIDSDTLLSGGIKDILNMDLNNKYIDENNILHIFITNKKGERFEALYSGKHIKEVINSNWYVFLKKKRVHLVQTSSYNKSGKNMLLHRVDFNDSECVDHINNNPLDNRIDNLRSVNTMSNSKNRKTNNTLNITGLKRSGSGYLSKYTDTISKGQVTTKTKHDLEEAKIDALIAQRYMGYRHNEELFYLLDNLPTERIKEVEDLLEQKINILRNKSTNKKESSNDIIDCGDYYKVICKGDEMLFDCSLDLVNNKSIFKNRGYWLCYFLENGKKVNSVFHRELFGIRPNEYSEYGIQVDHLNGDKNDNRYCNLAITTYYSNLCNKTGKGYKLNNCGTFTVQIMHRYKYKNLICNFKKNTFKTEQEAIDEVERRRQIIDNARVKLKSKEEIDKLINYCYDNEYLQDNGLADLDLGYLYYKGILKKEEVA